MGQQWARAALGLRILGAAFAERQAEVSDPAAKFKGSEDE
jgi:hypothetical protein